LPVLAREEGETEDVKNRDEDDPEVPDDVGSFGDGWLPSAELPFGVNSQADLVVRQSDNNQAKDGVEIILDGPSLANGPRRGLDVVDEGTQEELSHVEDEDGDAEPDVRVSGNVGRFMNGFASQPDAGSGYRESDCKLEYPVTSEPPVAERTEVPGEKSTSRQDTEEADGAHDGMGDGHIQVIRRDGNIVVRASVAATPVRTRAFCRNGGQ